jgi:hypothetical protein
MLKNAQKISAFRPNKKNTVFICIYFGSSYPGANGIKHHKTSFFVLTFRAVLHKGTNDDAKKI